MRHKVDVARLLEAFFLSNALVLVRREIDMVYYSEGEIMNHKL